MSLKAKDMEPHLFWLLQRAWDTAAYSQLQMQASGYQKFVWRQAEDTGYVWPDSKYCQVWIRSLSLLILQVFFFFFLLFFLRAFLQLFTSLSHTFPQNVLEISGSIPVVHQIQVISSIILGINYCNAACLELYSCRIFYSTWELYIPR